MVEPTTKPRSMTIMEAAGYEDEDVELRMVQKYWGVAGKPRIIPTLIPDRERDKIQLAKWLLLGLAVLFALGAIAHFTNPGKGGSVFEACKTILPPIATLVLGYYFSEKSSTRKE
jgi:hypothetical protein